MTKRSRLQIFFDVLDMISKGETVQTRIMYRSNLSWHKTRQVLATLLDQGYIQIDDPQHIKQYRVMPRGHSALRYYRRAVEDVVEQALP